MDSLPAQPIDGLSPAARKDAYEKLARLCFARSLGIDAEKELARKAEFPSVEVMHISLENWGLTSLLPSSERQPQKTQERKARTAKGARQELPSATNAATTFRDTIRTLEVYLEHMISLKESLQGHYFIGEGETDKSNVREARGAQWHPHPYLVVLIAVSILEHHGNWGFVERLLKELHPQSVEANRQQLVRFIYGKKVDTRGRPILNKKGHPEDDGDGLLDRARQIAALIRGKPEIKRGVKGPAIPSHHQIQAWHLRLLIEQGLSREEIAKREREELERYKLENKQSVLEELEFAKQTLNEADFAQESREIHEYLQQLSEQTFDEDEFDRIWKLARDLK